MRLRRRRARKRAECCSFFTIEPPTHICGFEGVSCSLLLAFGDFLAGVLEGGLERGALGSELRRKASPKYVRGRSSAQPNDVCRESAAVRIIVVSVFSSSMKTPE